jgi:acyl-CoA dehydrogenase
MMKAMIQEFIANEVLVKLMMNGRKQWYGKPRNMETGRRIRIVGMDMPETYGGAGLDFTFNALFIEEFAKKGIRVPVFLAF